MSLAEQAQPGAISDPTAFAEYLTFTLRDHDVTPDKIISALDMVANATKSIRQKDPDSQVSSTVGIGARAWPLLFPETAPSRAPRVTSSSW
jgi:putative iron-dependent peroxidase